jgi:formylglycine-generating enzyme required for sulfatase activity
MEDIELDDDCVNWAGGYRLPTLNEWEYAARGGLSSKRFPWGDTIDHTQANYYGNPHQYDYDLGYERYDTSYQVGEIPFTSPVGSFPANGYGLYDMTGNLWEWNWFPGFNRTPRPLRGSSWNDSSYCGRVAYVFRNVPGWRSYIQGFRLCTAGPG